MLALPAPIKGMLDSYLTNSILTATASTASLPVIGAAINNPVLVQSQVASISSQLDAAFDAGQFTSAALPGFPNIIRTTFNQPAHAIGAQSVPFTPIPGQTFFTLDPPPPNPDNTNPPPDPNANAYATMWVDTYLWLQFDTDTVSGTVTIDDLFLSQNTPTLTSWSDGIGLGHHWDVSVPAPDAPVAVVVLATLGPSFEANGKIAGVPVKILDHSQAAISAGETITLEEVTHVLATIDISLGNPSVGPGGTTNGNVNSFLSGEAHLNLDTHFQLDDELGLTVAAQVLGDWTFDQIWLTPIPPAQLPDAANFGTLPYLEFRDVTVDLGSTLRTLGSILSDIQSVTNGPAMHDIVALFDLDLPIIGKKLRDVADLLGVLPGGASDALALLAFINSLYVTGQNTGGVINTGSFQLADPRQGDLVIIQTQPSNGAPQEAESFLHDAFGVDIPNTNAQYGLHFLFLEDPEHVLFPVLAGEDRDLVTFVIPPIDLSFSMNDVFDAFGVFELFPDFPGVTADGTLNVQLEVVAGYDTKGIRRGARADATDATDSNFGVYIDTMHTRASIRGELTLGANAVAFSVSGGLSADVDVFVTGHLDPDNADRVRAGFLLDSVSNLILPRGKLTAFAEFDVAGESTTTPVDVTLLDFDIPGFTVDVITPGADRTIRIEKSNESEDIFVIQAHLDVSDGTPRYGTPAEYDLAIMVVYPEKREFYKIARFQQDAFGVYQNVQQYGNVELIFVGGASPARPLSRFTRPFSSTPWTAPDRSSSTRSKS